jgi:hypothetical protein
MACDHAGFKSVCSYQGENIVKTQGKNRVHLQHRKVLVAAAAAVLAQVGVSSWAGAQETISTAGSTALRNWFVVNTTTFTEVQPNTQITLNGTGLGQSVFPLNGTDWAANGNGGSTLVYQLAPSSVVSPSIQESPSNYVDQADALQFEYHESGSVEGILELANDQIAPVAYVTNNVDRNPNSGNAVWSNYNEIGGISAGGHTVVPFNENPANGAIGTGNTGNAFSTLNDFYPNGAVFNSSIGASAIVSQPVPQFNFSGGNLSVGGQAAVQLAISDAIPKQVFTNTTGTAASEPWFSTPANAGYGLGNTTLTAPANATILSLGQPQYRQVYQSTTSLNMPANAINPRSGNGSAGSQTTFGTGPWNTAGLGNLNNQYVASTATLFVANPGTGLTQVDRTDAQWLETTGRLANGAAFNMTTRDVNSGTRNVSALETGIDPTWAAGVNDDGDGNSTTGGTLQAEIGPGLKFSNKTAGGNELRPTVQINRFSVGTLSINDANGVANTTSANPIRALAYSDSTDGSAPYVNANYFTIAGVNTSSGVYAGSSYSTVNPSGLQYTIFQNEQVVTLKAPNAATYNLSSNTTTLQGDPNGDVESLINNTLNSVTQYNKSASSPASPAAGLISQGYIIPQYMAVEKAQNGLNVAGTASAIVANPGYTPALSDPNFSGLVNALTNSAPALVTAGTGSDYGASKLYGSGKGQTAGFNGAIPLTSYNTSNTATAAGGNYLLGNFNQTGVRDFYSAVVLAQQAQAALDASGAGNSAFTADGGLSNSTVVTTGTPVDFMQSGGATKGDLITLGDLNGDGKFDGKDLYLMAVDASLSDPGNRPMLTYNSTGGATITAGTGRILANAATFGAVIDSTVLNKNVALDYLQADATPAEKIEAKQVLTMTTSGALPAGATAIAASGSVTGVDSVTGFQQFTFDSQGLNSYNKSDVNQDGVVDINDALAVDSLNGKSFGSLTDALSSSIPAPVTGLPEQANLVLATQLDTNTDGSTHTTISTADLAVVNTALTGPGTTNWYAYTAEKTGTGTITWNRSNANSTATPNIVNVNAGASLQIGAGTLQVINSGVDPFTDNNTNLPSSPTDTSKSLAIAVTTGGTLEYTSGGTGIQVDRLSAVNISGGSVIVDPAAIQSNRSLLIAGSLSISGSVGKLDLGNSDMIVQGGNISSVNSLVKAGYANGTWTGNGISSAAAANDSTHLTALGVIQNSVDGSPTGTALYGTAGALGLFDGVSPNAADVLVKYTYYGDTNLDGKVDGTDYSKIDFAYTHPGLTGWANGDFNYDGVIDGSDYTLIDNAFNSQGAVLSASFAATPTDQVAGGAIISGGTAAVPEPASLGLLGLGIGSLLSRRRRRLA